MWWLPLLAVAGIAWWLTQWLLSPATAVEVPNFAPWGAGMLNTLIFGAMTLLLAQLREARHTKFGITVRKQRRTSSAMAVPLHRSIVVLWSVIAVAALLFLVGLFQNFLSPEHKVLAVAAVVSGVAYAVAAAAMMVHWYRQVDNLRQRLRDKDELNQARKNTIERLKSTKPAPSGSDDPTNPPRFQAQMNRNGT